MPHVSFELNNKGFGYTLTNAKVNKKEGRYFKDKI